MSLDKNTAYIIMYMNTYQVLNIYLTHIVFLKGGCKHSKKVEKMSKIVEKFQDKLKEKKHAKKH